MDHPLPERRPRPLLAPVGPPPAPDRAALPVPRTPLLGREDDVAAVAAAVRGGAPWLTLSGPGGVGKTRLALAVAAAVGDEFADGVAFVALAAIRDPALVAPTIAFALGLRDGGDRPLGDRLVAHLRPRGLLLVLDNLEQVAAAAPEVGALLAACPGLQIVATSRVVLHLADERNVPVAPLAAPAADADPGAAAALGFAAVALFVARAEAVAPGFALTAGNAPTVAAICRRLDGLPLALELAAARLNVLPLPALLARLERALPVLTDGARDHPDRLRTMRGAIAWSYDLLDAPHRRLVRCWSVFVGGFGLAGAAAAIGDPAAEPLDGIAALVDASLLRQVADADAAEPRYRMLETIREFGLEQLAEAGEWRAAHDAHAAWVLRLARASAEAYFSPGYEATIARLAAEYDNARAALSWVGDSGDGERLLHLAGALASYWVVRGPYDEGRGWLERALAGAAATPSRPRALALIGLGHLARFRGDLDAAEACETAALAVGRVLGDRVTEARAFLGLAHIFLLRNDHPAALEWADGARARFQEIEHGASSGRHFLSRAEATLGRIHLARGDIERARGHLQEALRRQRTLDYAWGLSDTLRMLGDVARERGDAATALACYRESVALHRSHRDGRFLADALAGIAAVAAAGGQPERAARLYGATQALRDLIGAPVERWERGAHERRLAALEAGLGEAAFAAAWNAGAAMTADAAVADAAGDAAADPPAPEPSAAAAAPPRFGLSGRERDVLRLVAKGLSDREIAAALSISPRTVGSHVTNLLAKLGVESRTAAAVVALRDGLA